MSLANKDVCIKCGKQKDIGLVVVIVAQYPTFGKTQDGGRKQFGLQIHSAQTRATGGLDRLSSKLKMQIAHDFNDIHFVQQKF